MSRDPARAVLARHGRSFHWASRLLSGVQAERAARLYAFCRRVDDLADAADAATAAPALQRIRRDLQDGASSDPLVEDFLRLCIETAIPLEVVLRFLDAVESDLGRVRMADRSQLVRYAYGVAGTVGLMMCAVLEVRRAEALPFAVDLGVAMQLTNVARDVAEDARCDRRYLPAGDLPASLEPREILAAGPAQRIALETAVHGLLHLAGSFYRSADAGMHHLPWRARLGILTASRVYEGIGSELRRSGSDFLDRRIVLGTGSKLRHTLRALGALLFRPRYWGLGRARPHAAALHLALRRLPGADPAA